MQNNGRYADPNVKVTLVEQGAEMIVEIECNFIHLFCVRIYWKHAPSAVGDLYISNKTWTEPINKLTHSFLMLQSRVVHFVNKVTFLFHMCDQLNTKSSVRTPLSKKIQIGRSMPKQHVTLKCKWAANILKQCMTNWNTSSSSSVICSAPTTRRTHEHCNNVHG